MPGRTRSAAGKKPARAAKRAGKESIVEIRVGPPPGKSLEMHSGKPPVPGETILELILPGDLNLKYAYSLRILGAILARIRVTAEEEGRIQSCLDEGLQNAIVWGSAGVPKKVVTVRAWLEDGAWGLTISDQGKGFGLGSLPDYESEEFPLMDRGRGIFRLIHLAGEIAYYDGGRTLLLKG